jgi:hypothetical protein
MHKETRSTCPYCDLAAGAADRFASIGNTSVGTWYA